MKNNLTITDRQYLRRIEGKLSPEEVEAFKAQMRPLVIDWLRWLRFRFKDAVRWAMKLCREWRYQQWKQRQGNFR